MSGATGPWKPAILKLTPFGREYDEDFTVESRTGSARYTLNLFRYTCTCPDFVQRRSSYPVGDIGRSCKHLRDAVLAVESHPIGDDLTRVIFKSPYGPYDRIWFTPGPDGEIIALGVARGKRWVNLFVRRGPGGAYDRYGYDPEEKRWAYGSEPPGVETVLLLLTAVPGGLFPKEE